MKCILAQGNPGLEYSPTRHNIGFVCLEAYAEQLGASFTNKSKFQAEVAEVNLHGEKLILVKPTTFYNQTGRSLRAIKDFYKLDSSDILVIHDDLALEFGKIRVRHQGSDGGNNGIKSINSSIGQNYARLRIGINSPRGQLMDSSDFVLSRFSEAERASLNQHVLPLCFQVIEAFINQNLVDESFSIVK